MSKPQQFELEAEDSDFQEKVVEQSKRIPVLVDFWAAWCAPCLMLKPILERLAKEYKGKFVLAKVNVEKARNIAIQYRIASIPTVKLFKQGKVVAEFHGAMAEEKVKEWLKKHL